MSQVNKAFKASSDEVELTEVDVSEEKGGSVVGTVVDVKRHFPGFEPFSKRKCTDCLCLVIFILFLCGWFGLLAVGIMYGKPEVLYRATDYNGNICGEYVATGNTFKDGKAPPFNDKEKDSDGAEFTDATTIAKTKYGAMPRLVDDILAASLQAASGDFSLPNITTVCVEKCPSIGDIICKYDLIEKVNRQAGNNRLTANPITNGKDDGYDFKTQFHAHLRITSQFPRFVAASNKDMMKAVNAACAGAPTAPLWWLSSTNDDGKKQTTKDYCLEVYNACDETILESGSTLGRCIPKFKSPKESVQERCVDPLADTTCTTTPGFTTAFDPFCINGTDPVYTPSTATFRFNSDVRKKCKKLEVLDSTISEELPQASFLNTIAKATGKFSSYVVAVKTAWPVVAGCGLVIALLLGFLFLIILRRLASCIVWTSIVCVQLLFIAGSILALLRGGVFDNKYIPGAVAARAPISIAASSDEDKATYYQIGGYTLAVCSIVYFCIILFVRKAINDAIRIVKISATAVGANCKIVFWPLFSFLIVGLSSLLFAVVAVLLMSSGDMIAVKMQNATASVTSDSSSNFTAITIPDIKQVKPQEMIKYLGLFDLFMWFWLNEFAQAIGVFTIGGTIAEWYFTPKGAEPEDLSDRTRCQRWQSSGICGAFCVGMKKHAGTAAFGSLIIAIISTIRAVVAYLQYQITKANPDSKLIKCVTCITSCCLKCLENCAKYLTKNAYIYSAVKGTNFCWSAYKSFILLWNNLMRFGATGISSALVMLFGKVFIMMLSVVVGYNLLNMFYSDASKVAYISDVGQFVCCVVILCFSYVVAEVFFSVYDIATDTILISYCFDIDQASGKAFEDKMGMPLPIEKSKEEPDASEDEQKDKKFCFCCKGPSSE